MSKLREMTHDDLNQLRAKKHNILNCLLLVYSCNDYVWIINLQSSGQIDHTSDWGEKNAETDS